MLELRDIGFSVPVGDSVAEPDTRESIVDDITAMPINERSQVGIVYGFQHPARFKGTTYRDRLPIVLGSDDDDTLV